jgi:HK97 family phage major capsid protein
MSLSKAREMREERSKLVIKAQELMANASKITDEIRAEFDAKMKEADVLKSDYERIEAAEAVAGEIRAVRPPEQNLNTRTKESAEQEYRKAFKDYAVNGKLGMSAESRDILTGTDKEFRDLSIGTTTSGGFFVPSSFTYSIEQAAKAYGPMLKLATTTVTAGGNPLPFPTSNDTSNEADIVAEAGSVNSADPAIGSMTLGAFKFESKLVKVSLELLQDSAFNIQTWLANIFGERFGRGMSRKFTVGAGTTEPKGIIIAATAGPTATGSKNNTGGTETGGATIGTADLLALESALDPAYRPGAAFMLHDSSLQYIKGLLDKQGRPIFLSGVANNAPDMIMGYPVYVNQHMDTLAINHKSVAFGRFDKYQIRMAGEGYEILRLNELFAQNGQVGFLAFRRADGNLLDAGTHPVVYLTQAAA